LEVGESTLKELVMGTHVSRSLLTVVVLMVSVCAGQASQDSPTNASFHKVYFVDRQRGWMLGSAPNESMILQSRDGGESWQEQYRSAEGLYSIKFASPEIGWVVGSRGTILHTNDGGDSWTRQRSGTDVLLLGLAVLDASDAWATGASGTLLYTTDGGDTWNKKNISSSVGISDITFADPKHGWAVGYGTILSTVDGGETWRVKSSGQWKPLTSVIFANQNLGWIAVGPVILKTTDGGETWAETSPPSQGQLSGLSFVDAQHGWVAKSRGEEGSVVHVPGKDTISSESYILSTSDGGRTWQSIFQVGSPIDHSAWVLNIFFVNATTGWAVGRDGLILRTIDAGKSWQRTHLPQAALIPHHLNLTEKYIWALKPANF
jgi:photosystem II stability/assembly factor-like uncharacterized protein